MFRDYLFLSNRINPMSPVKAVIFDAFGTVVKIGERRHPYRQMLTHGIKQGRQTRAEDARVIMTNPLTLEAAARNFGISISPADLRRMQLGLEEELHSIELFEDALPAIEELRSVGIKVGICSNLAAPYGEPVKRFLPTVDAYAFSFEIGAIKPEPRMYQVTIDRLGVEAQETWMIGDSQICDRDGPTEFGIKGHHLNRIDASGDFAKLTSFMERVLPSRSRLP
jgi:FMN phosphatase YigB (HAD superfamily)